MQPYSAKDALSAARERDNSFVNVDEIIRLSTGVLVRIKSVSASLIDAAQTSVPPPEVPIWHNENTGKDEENPNHPKYLEDLEVWQMQKVLAAVDVMLMFGVDLVNDAGEVIDIEEGRWTKQLKFLEKHGRLDISEYDLSDPFDREFVYKKFVAIGAPDIQLIAEASSLSEEDVAKAAASFQDNEAWDTNS